MKALPSFCSLKGAAPVKPATPTAPENTWGKKVLPYPSSEISSDPAVKQEPRTHAPDKIRIVGGQELNGVIPISGAKNAALKMMCAALLTDQSLHLENMPNTLRDIDSQTELLTHLGCMISTERDLMAINAKNIHDLTAPYEIVRKMRGSILVLGPLLARFGEAKVSLPGGCAIGARPIDQHLKVLEALGA
ncbi:MAG TPA: hypothetical protein DEA55_02535, partial [Rhodospirillaceae bacterium]|nr:hypothetical protein [Rhodospirillaceae bacterium]